jgi:hypothetical protein
VFSCTSKTISPIRGKPRSDYKTETKLNDPSLEKDAVFEGFENAKFKLDYFHNEGYSTGNRYWYEVIIIDSMLVLNFECPQNDDWNHVYYQKLIILDEKKLKSIKKEVNLANLHQKTEGFPYWSDWSGSGYGKNRLYIETNELSLAGGMIYNNIFGDHEVTEVSISDDMRASTTISGDYESLFEELEKLFDSLPFLMKEKDRVY